MADVDYKWKIGKNKGIEIVSSELAQFDLLRVVTENKASTNSKGEITHVFLAHIPLLPKLFPVRTEGKGRGREGLAFSAYHCILCVKYPARSSASTICETVASLYPPKNLF